MPARFQDLDLGVVVVGEDHNEPGLYVESQPCASTDRVSPCVDIGVLLERRKRQGFPEIRFLPVETESELVVRRGREYAEKS